MIGPDKGGLVKELQGQAEAAAKVKDIINAARTQGRDPRPDIDNAAKDTSLSSATRRYIVELAHRGGRRSDTNAGTDSAAKFLPEAIATDAGLRHFGRKHIWRPYAGRTRPPH